MERIRSDSIDNFSERSQGHKPFSHKAVQTTLSDHGEGTDKSTEDVGDWEGTEMGSEEVMSKTLPEGLVEKIIALMPYPSIFKARLLSRSWFAKLKPISSLHTEEEKHLAISFQKRVAENSINWDTFCTVVWPAKEKPMIAYNQAKQKWQALPSVSFFPDNLFHSTWMGFHGAVIYWSPGFDVQTQVYVGNIFTREWKMLSVRPLEECAFVIFMELVIDKFLETYKVILLCESFPDGAGYVLQVYDSKSETWRSKSSDNDTVVMKNVVSAIFHDGVLYMVSSDHLDCLWAFNVENWTLEELVLTFDPYASLPNTAKLVICNDSLVVIGITTQFRTVHVLKVDLKSLQLLEVARYPVTVNPDVVDIISMTTGIFSSLTLNNVDAIDIIESTMYMFSNCPTFDRTNRTFSKFSEYDSGIVEHNKVEDKWKMFQFSEYDSIIVEYNKDEDKWEVFNILDLYKCWKELEGGRITYSWRNCKFQPGLNPFMAI